MYSSITDLPIPLLARKMSIQSPKIFQPGLHSVSKDVIFLCLFYHGGDHGGDNDDDDDLKLQCNS